MYTVFFPGFASSAPNCDMGLTQYWPLSEGSSHSTYLCSAFEIFQRGLLWVPLLAKARLVGLLGCGALALELPV